MNRVLFLLFALLFQTNSTTTTMNFEQMENLLSQYDALISAISSKSAVAQTTTVSTSLTPLPTSSTLFMTQTHFTGHILAQQGNNLKDIGFDAVVGSDHHLTSVSVKTLLETKISVTTPTVTVTVSSNPNQGSFYQDLGMTKRRNRDYKSNNVSGLCVIKDELQVIESDDENDSELKTGRDSQSSLVVTDVEVEVVDESGREPDVLKMRTKKKHRKSKHSRRHKRNTHRKLSNNRSERDNKQESDTEAEKALRKNRKMKHNHINNPVDKRTKSVGDEKGHRCDKREKNTALKDPKDDRKGESEKNKKKKRREHIKRVKDKNKPREKNDGHHNPRKIGTIEPVANEIVETKEGCLNLATEFIRPTQVPEIIRTAEALPEKVPVANPGACCMNYAETRTKTLTQVSVVPIHHTEFLLFTDTVVIPQTVVLTNVKYEPYPVTRTEIDTMYMIKPTNGPVGGCGCELGSNGMLLPGGQLPQGIFATPINEVDRSKYDIVGYAGQNAANNLQQYPNIPRPTQYF